MAPDDARGHLWIFLWEALDDFCYMLHVTLHQPYLPNLLLRIIIDRFATKPTTGLIRKKNRDDRAAAPQAEYRVVEQLAV